MANVSHTKKAIRSSARKRVFNLRRIRTMREAIKSLEELITGGKKKEATAAMPTVYKAIDKAAKGGIIKANNASRKKSRLSARVAKLG